METVSVTGGSGAIGRMLLEQLEGRFQVRALFRSHSAIREQFVRSGGQLVEGDLRDPAALARLVEGAATVYHCAASVTRGLKQ
ncbi:MAG: NAD(P)H-binding protein, partial [Planctomycetaceae bacterium]|nr:NAD(P)H-binding protein [Planctomycetaceae bacterium]